MQKLPYNGSKLISSNNNSNKPVSIVKFSKFMLNLICRMENISATTTASINKHSISNPTTISLVKYSHSQAKFPTNSSSIQSSTASIIQFRNFSSTQQQQQSSNSRDTTNNSTRKIFDRYSLIIDSTARKLSAPTSSTGVTSTFNTLDRIHVTKSTINSAKIAASRLSTFAHSWRYAQISSTEIWRNRFSNATTVVDCCCQCSNSGESRNVSRCSFVFRAESEQERANIDIFWASSEELTRANVVLLLMLTYLEWKFVYLAHTKIAGSIVCGGSFFCTDFHLSPLPTSH